MNQPWPAAVRWCFNQCADEHLQYCRREQQGTDKPGWCNALVNLQRSTPPARGTPA